MPTGKYRIDNFFGVIQNDGIVHKGGSYESACEAIS